LAAALASISIMTWIKSLKLHGKCVKHRIDLVELT
jgi:hypothetical protein